MRLNPEHMLRHIGSHYMIVDSCADNANLTNVFTLNDTAAYLWESVRGIEFTAEDLVKLLCDQYEVDVKQAREDVASLLSSWQEYHLIV